MTPEQPPRVAGPSRKKTPYTVSTAFNFYLKEYERAVDLPIKYEDLLRFTTQIPLYDIKGNDTLWKTVFYSDWETDEIHDALRRIYAYLQADGDDEVLEMKHLRVARVDFCSFGNTQPFRIRIINDFNDNYDHFYVKRADASRIYGLELEHLLSPNRMSFLYDGHTLIEEHIPGIPGDIFVQEHLDDDITFNQIRIAKEFVKFNERCLVRLLGDMRAYNFVVDATPDFEATQFRIRAVDFDQQSYEGHKYFYTPQFYKENRALVQLVMKHMNLDSVRQYRLEERSKIATRVRSIRYRLKDLIEVMKEDTLAPPAKVNTLRQELSLHYHRPAFMGCRSMGDILEQSILLLLERNR